MNISFEILTESGDDEYSPMPFMRHVTTFKIIIDSGDIIYTCRSENPDSYIRQSLKRGLIFHYNGLTDYAADLIKEIIELKKSRGKPLFDEEQLIDYGMKMITQ